MDQQNDPKVVLSQPAYQEPKARSLGLIIAIIATFLITGGAVFVWQQAANNAKQKQNEIVINQLQQQLTDLQNKIKNSENDTLVTREVTFKLVGSDIYQRPTSTYDIYLKNTKDNQKEYFTRIDQVSNQYVGGGDSMGIFNNGYLYIIRSFGGELTVAGRETYELWKYGLDKQGVKVFSADDKGWLSFRVSKKGNNIAVMADQLYFIDNKGNVKKSFQRTDIDSRYQKVDSPIGISLFNWLNESEIWLTGKKDFSTLAIYKISTDSWKITNYDLSKFDISRDAAINMSADKIASDNAPLKGGIDPQENISLILYDLNTNQSKEIAKTKGKGFAPAWINQNILEYNNPNGDGKLTYTIE